MGLDERVRWVNHGYTAGSDVGARFREIRDEVRYFGLETFVKRRQARYFSGRRIWR